MHLLRSLATGGSCDFTSGATGVQLASNRISTTVTVYGLDRGRNNLEMPGKRHRT